jgi:nitroreductase
MDLSQALRTTGAIRSFTDEPVDDATLAAVLETARFAPSGGNRQPWRVAVVRNPALRRELADLMQPVWNQYVAIRNTGATPFAYGSTIDVAPIESPNPLLSGIESVPVVLAIAANMHHLALMDGELERPPISGGASIYPFCWNLLLAAREHGLGGVITTFLGRVEPAAAPLLHLPDHHALAATIFLGHPVKQLTKLTRQPVSSFATVDTFDGEAFGD